MSSFDFFFYTLLIGSTFGSYFIIRSASAFNRFYRFLKGSFVFFCGLMWLWQILLWTLPKGNLYAEAVQLPRHFWHLRSQPPLTIDSQKHAYGEQDRQYLVYYPASANSPNAHKVIFYLHGGGWHVGSPDQHKHLAKVLHQQGYTVIMPAYRLGPIHDYYDMQEDVNQALVKSLALLKEAGIEQPALIIGGTSAGGNLASLLTYDEQRWEDLNIDRNIVKGSFSIVGVLDLNFMEPTMTLHNYTGPPESEQYDLANPITRISSADTIPLLCLNGGKDGLAPCENNFSFCKKLQSVSNNLVEMHTFPNASHIDVGAAWYYDSSRNLGQDSILLHWLQSL